MVVSKNSSHGGYAGKSIIERIEIQMDKRRKAMEKILVGTGNPLEAQYLTERGRYEGLAAALALLRSSTVAVEISRSNERLGIE